MSDKTIALSNVMPSATPSEAEIEAWNELPRDEQVRRLRQELARSDACVAGSHTMQDVWVEIRARRQAADLKHG